MASDVPLRPDQPDRLQVVAPSAPFNRLLSPPLTSQSHPAGGSRVPALGPFQHRSALGRTEPLPTRIGCKCYFNKKLQETRRGGVVSSHARCCCSPPRHGAVQGSPPAASYIKARPVQKVFQFYLETELLVQLEQFFPLTELDLRTGELPRRL